MANWEQNVRKVTPYVPGEQPAQSGIIKLNTNENPYPPAPGVAKALQELEAERLRLYPDPTASELTKALAARYGVNENQVFVGVGSDDVLALAFLTFFNGAEPILFPDITYSFYEVWANLYRIPYRCPPLDEHFCIRKEDYCQACGGIVLANPNAPTGLAADLSVIEEIVRSNPKVIVIVDEAYIDFGGTSAVSLIPSYENLLVVQTFSKSRSMAGMRIGYALGQPALIRYLQDVKYSFNSYTMDLSALKLGAAALADEAYFQQTLEKIIGTRERVKGALQELGFVCLDSQSSFIFAAHPVFSAAELFEALKRQQIYVRHFDRPRISDYLRITVGTEEEMERLLSFLRQLVQR